MWRPSPTEEGDLPRMRGGARHGKAKAVPDVLPNPNAAPARPKAKGRPAKSEKPEQSLQTPPTVLEHGYDGKDAFLKAQKEWAATLLPDQRFLSVTSGTLFNQGSKFVVVQ